MSDSKNSGDEIWEEISVDSDGFTESSENSSDVDSDNVEPEDEVEVIRGAEPYRFEPLAKQRRAQLGRRCYGASFQVPFYYHALLHNCPSKLT